MSTHLTRRLRQQAVVVLVLLSIASNGCDTYSPAAPERSVLEEFVLLEGSVEWTATSVSWKHSGEGRSRFAFIADATSSGCLFCWVSHLFDALYNLGTRAAELDRWEQAERALTRFVDLAPPERYAADLRRARVLLSRRDGARQEP